MSRTWPDPVALLLKGPQKYLLNPVVCMCLREREELYCRSDTGQWRETHVDSTVPDSKWPSDLSRPGLGTSAEGVGRLICFSAGVRLWYPDASHALLPISLTVPVPGRGQY